VSTASGAGSTYLIPDTAFELGIGSSWISPWCGLWTAYVDGAASLGVELYL
jgi:hypothetical protein